MNVRIWGATAALGLALPTVLAGPARAAAPAVPFDFDGDRYPDLVVGVGGLSAGSVYASGGVVVLRGSKKGLSLDERVISQSTPGVPGASENSDFFGSAVASADFDGDGFADLAVGAPSEDIGSVLDQGGVTVVYGSRSGLDTGRTSSLTSAGSGVYGTALVAGDFVGDGHVDLAVGAPGEDRVTTPNYASPGGVVHILRGTDQGLVSSGEVTVRRRGDAADGDTAFGSTLAAGDLNGDQKTDLVVGSSGRDFDEAGYAGSVSVCLGATAGPSGCTRVAHTDHLAGLTALAVGNVSGSSAPEIVAGSKYRIDGAGFVTILRLGDDGVSLARSTELDEDSRGVPGGAEDTDYFGQSLVLGDIDRDGHDDMVIGSRGEDGYRGRVTVVRGADGGYATSGNYTLDQDTEGVPGKAERGDGFGSALTLLDHDHDGRLDLSVGAPGENDAAGSVTTFEGSGRTLKGKGSRAFGLDVKGFREPRETFFGDTLGVPARS